MSNEQITNLDEAIQVDLSEDKMSAYLIFKRVEGTIQLTVQDLEKMLNGRGVKHGIQQDILNMISARPQDFFFTQNVVAIGTPARNGTDGYIKSLYGEDDQSRKPAERSDGSVDYREVAQLANVKAGQLIAERYPPLPGINGTDVTGGEVRAKEGKEAHFKVGKNVVVNAEKTGLYAAMDGLVTKTEKDKLNVFPVYEVNGDVDYHIGNIDFVGTVVIRGNVLNGFKIRASGDIRVTGGIEGAEVESDGSIEISGGIIGNNKGLVKAGRSIKCSFIQEGIVQANEDILVTQSIMHSNVKAGREIVCMGSKGLVVGGTLQAGDRITARMIGNAMSTATSIEVGVRPELRQELNDLRAVIRTLTESLDKTDKALALLNQLAATGQLPPQRMTMRLQLNATRKQTAEELQTAKESILEIEKMLEDTSSARVDGVHTIYGGTKIVIGRYTRFIKDSVQRVSFRFIDGEIVPVPYIG
jgi:Predicted polymerase, most proteins contain PALM domain, HD hydrolase domain and Zn-ribbon domain